MERKNRNPLICAFLLMALIGIIFLLISHSKREGEMEPGKMTRKEEDTMQNIDEKTGKEDKVTVHDENENLNENITLFDGFNEMDYVLFLETNIGWGLTLDYHKYGIYGDFTQTAEDGEALFFRLNEKILKEKKHLSSEPPVLLTHQEWAYYAGEHIVYLTPNLEWIVSRQFTDLEMNPDVYCEKWYHNQDIVNEISGDITRNTLTFIPYKDASNSYEAMSATRILELNELLNKIYQGFGIRDEKRICLDESAQILAAGECRQEGTSIYDVYEEKCIRIYDISNEEPELLCELSVPKSEIAWPVEISQLVGDREKGWMVFSAGDSAYKMSYPDGEVQKIGEFMFDGSYSPDGKYMAYCTGNVNLFDSWEDLYDEEEKPNDLDLDLYYSMRERWDAIAPGWYVEELETGKKTYIPVEVWTDDMERPIYGGRCLWIERERLFEILK